MKIILEGVETPEDEQAFIDQFTIALFNMYIERIEKKQEDNKNIRA